MIEKFTPLTWMLADIIIFELILITTFAIKRLSGTRFWHIMVNAFSSIILLIAISLGVISAISLNKSPNELILSSGFY